MNRLDNSTAAWESTKNLNRYLADPIKCINPKCGADLQPVGVAGPLVQLNPSEVFQDVQCAECGVEWRDIYVLKRIRVAI